jgi:hypothetical protein
MNYRVEFNEEQQAFHLSRVNADRPNTNGWWTVVDSCSDQMYWEFICMLETLHEKPYDRKKILNAQAKLAAFWALLNKNRLLIVKQEDVQQDALTYSSSILAAADDWVFNINGGKWSNNDNTAGDNFASFVAGAKYANGIKCEHINVISLRHAYKCTNCGTVLEPE